MKNRRKAPFRGKPSALAPHKPTKTLLGVIQKNRQGFAFILPRSAQMEDVYVSRGEAALLMTGDVVEFRLQHTRGRSSAEILRVVERGQKNAVGWIRSHGSDFFLETAGEEYFLIDSHVDRKQIDHWAVGQITAYPTRKGHAAVRITQDFGVNLTPESDIAIAVAQFGLPDHFSPAAIHCAEEAQKEGERILCAPPSQPSQTPERKDLRHLPLVTIDGEDAKDFDDAIYVEGVPEGFSLYVAIADVSFYVRPGSPLDNDARGRGTSVYFPGSCIPMLPEILSNGACSLRPQEDKLALTAQILFSRDGHVIDTQFFESLIRTARRLTYNEVHSFFTGNVPPSLEEASVAEAMKRAHALYKILDKNRKARGVLDFDLGESKIEVDAKGTPLSVFKAPRYESHQLIEEFMIAANSAVAKALREAKREDALFRVHETPDIEKLEEVNRLMRSLGISQTIQESTPRAFARVLLATKDLKGAKTVHQNILRTQKQARYEPEPKGHFGLALRDYAHFTSPIRRYPDLVVHRALKRLIHRGKNADKDRVDYTALGEATSSQERRAMEAERFVTRRKQCWFMEDHLGETHSGIISGIIEKGLFVELDKFSIEGFLSVDSLNGSYVYDEKKLCLRRRPGHTTLSIGDAVRVVVEEVSVLKNEITFGEAK